MKREKETFESANIIECEVGTTGLMGGDAGHGGETFFRIQDAASTAWQIVVTDENGEEVFLEQPRSVTVMVQSDTELQTIAEALEWAARKIKALSA